MFNENKKPKITYRQSEDIMTYLKKKGQVSDTDVIEFLRSPLHYFERNKEDLRTSQKLGEAIIHSAVDPESMMFDYVNSPKFDMRKEENKRAAAEFYESNPNKVILYPSEQALIRQAAANCVKNTLIWGLIENSEFGNSFHNTDKPTGIEIKLRPSASLDLTVSFEVRISRFPSPEEFMTDVRDFQLDVSAAMHMDFMNVEKHVFLVVEKDEPHHVVAYELTDKMIITGRKKYRMALDIMKWCTDNNHWCTYNEFEVIKLFYETTGSINHFTPEMLNMHKSVHIIGSTIKEQVVQKYAAKKPVSPEPKAKAKAKAKAKEKKAPVKPAKVKAKSPAKTKRSLKSPKSHSKTTKTSLVSEIVEKMKKKPSVISNKEKASTLPIFPDLFSKPK